jgi:hypothetical protein
MKSILVSSMCVLFITCSYDLSAQKKKFFSFGLNAIYFNDWKHAPISFFNPEIRYIRTLPKNSAIDIGLNGLYSSGSFKDFTEPGDIINRLFFTADFTFKKYFRHFSFNIGPSIRSRNEKIRANCTYCPFSEIVLEGKGVFIDLGGVAGLNYQLFLKKGTSFEIRSAYRYFNKGVNPLSLGLFYNWVL